MKYEIGTHNVHYLRKIPPSSQRAACLCLSDACNTDSPLQKKRISIKNLFLSAPKFQKSVKRGVHLACLLCCEDKVLVTSEEQLPIIEVDENFSGTSIQSDLYWLMKVRAGPGSGIAWT